MSSRHLIVAALALTLTGAAHRPHAAVERRPMDARQRPPPGEQGRRRGALGDHPEPLRLLRDRERLLHRRPGPVVHLVREDRRGLRRRRRRARPAVPLLRQPIARVGGFTSPDWTLISDQVVLPLSFFIPEAETCDLQRRPERPERQQRRLVLELRRQRRHVPVPDLRQRHRRQHARRARSSSTPSTRAAASRSSATAATSTSSTRRAATT